jgi:hypothetical protein
MMVEPHDYIVPSQNLETRKVLLQVQMISVRCPRTSSGMWTEADLDSTSPTALACKTLRAT